MQCTPEEEVAAAEELETLEAIYGEEMSAPDHRGWRSVTLSLRVLPMDNNQPTCDLDEDLCSVPLKASFVLPASGYPTEKLMPFHIEVVSDNQGETEQSSLRSRLCSIVSSALTLRRVEEHLEQTVFQPGSTSVFDVVEWLRSDLEEYLDVRQDVQSVWREWYAEDSAASTNDDDTAAMDRDVTVYRSEAFTDRKSKFLAHLAEVTCKADVDAMMKEVLSDRKVAAATHNILAYRFRNPDGSLDAHRDDDGEGGAGDKLLNLLQQCNIEGVAIVVTRWYGGIHLGPDRFKRINERAKDILRERGFIQ